MAFLAGSVSVLLCFHFPARAGAIPQTKGPSNVVGLADWTSIASITSWRRGCAEAYVDYLATVPKSVQAAARSAVGDLSALLHFRANTSSGGRAEGYGETLMRALTALDMISHMFPDHTHILVGAPYGADSVGYSYAEDGVPVASLPLGNALYTGHILTRAARQNMTEVGRVLLLPSLYQLAPLYSLTRIAEPGERLKERLDVSAFIPTGAGIAIVCDVAWRTDSMATPQGRRLVEVSPGGVRGGGRAADVECSAREGAYKISPVFDFCVVDTNTGARFVSDTFEMRDLALEVSTNADLLVQVERAPNQQDGISLEVQVLTITTGLVSKRSMGHLEYPAECGAATA